MHLNTILTINFFFLHLATFMNSDTTLFHEICLLFEELDKTTAPATLKRANASGDTGSSIYLTKEAKTKVFTVISQWFSKFDSGSLLIIFRLLVPEVEISPD